MKYFLLIISVLVLFSCNSNNNNGVQTYEIKKGKFYIDIVETGELNATRSKNVFSPAISWRYGMLKINHIVEDGSEVKLGDTLVLFDPSEIFKARIDANANLEIAQADYNKLIAEQESRIQELESNLKINEISFDIAKIKLEQAAYEADVTKKEIELNLEKTEISLKKARNEIGNQKKIHKEEAIQSLLRIKQLEAQVEEANRTLEKLTVTSPGDGIAIISRNRRTRNKWQVGDQPWPGSALIQLPDLSELKVETEINEVDIAKINLEQAAEIRLDAFSEKLYPGKVTTVATLAKFKDEDKSNIKVFPIEVILEEISEELMPGMTVSCRIIVDELDDMIYVPIEALFKEPTGSFVYLKSGKKYKKIPVVTGLANNDYIIIAEGVSKGDVVALSLPPEFAEKSTEKENGNE